MTEQEYYTQATGDHGLKLINDTDSHDFPFTALVIREDTVIDSWTDEDGFDLVAFFRIDSETLYVTDPVLKIPAGKATAELTLASGSVFGIL